MTKKQLETTLVQAGRSKKYTQGSVNSVIQRASSLVFDTVEDKKIATRNRAKGGLFYGRRGTLTHFSLQEAMCELEGGAGCALYFASIVFLSRYCLMPRRKKLIMASVFLLLAVLTLSVP